MRMNLSQNTAVIIRGCDGCSFRQGLFQFQSVRISSAGPRIAKLDLVFGVHTIAADFVLEFQA